MDEVMNEICEELLGLGIGDVHIEYNGASDEGWIGEITAKALQGSAELAIPTGINDQIERWAYDVLENYHPGWEINEGSDGRIALNVSAKTASLSHNENLVTQKNETTDFSV